MSSELVTVPALESPDGQALHEMSRRACVFCGYVGKLTLEHVIPRWIHGALKLTGPVEYGVGDREQGIRIERTAPGLDVTFRGVCQSCNNGWLHDLETAFRTGGGRGLPGRVIELSPMDQAVAAAWGVKTWLLAERVGWRGRRPAFTGGTVLPYLREHREPPDTFQVWLAALDSPQLFWHTSELIPPDPPHMGGLGIIAVGCLVFHIYAPGVWADQATFGLPLVPDGEFADYFLSIWPRRTDTVTWPPRYVLSFGDLQRLWPRGTKVRRPGV